MTITCKHFVAQGHAAPTYHQADAHLFAIGPMVSRITALCLRIAVGLAFKVSRGHVVDQKVVLQAKQFAQAVFQVFFQCFFVGQQLIQGAIPPVIIDLLRRHTQ